MDNRSSRQGGILDHAAITLSGLCLVHCLLLPVIIVAVPLGVLAASRARLGFRRHANQAIIAGGIAGIGMLFIGGTVVHASYGILADSLLTIAGSLVLATSHYFNNRLMRHVPAR